MTSYEKINNLIDQVRAFFNLGKVIYTTPEYVKFHRELEQFVFENGLQDTKYWSTIVSNLLVRSNQYMVGKEADTILTALENLKQIVMEKTYSSKYQFDLMNPLILKVAQKKIFDGHYADAVESAFKEIESRVKRLAKVERPELASKVGVGLMTAAFAKDNPAIILGDGSDSDNDIQLGYMHLFAGGMSALRNPKAHANLDIDKESAMRMLIFASTLMFTLDKYEVEKADK